MLWTTLSGQPTNTGNNKTERWLFEAINHPGGKLVQFWLFAVSRRRVRAGEDWSGLTDDYRRLPEEVLTENSYAAELGRILLAGQLSFLFSTDAEWTRQNVLPLLDWSSNARRARQAWHGFLSRGTWNEALLPDLLPLYEETFARLAGLPQGLRRQFTKHLASIAVFGAIGPLEQGWLGRFVGVAEPTDRESWASEIGLVLRQLGEGATRDLWDGWLGEYWSRRNRGMPRPLNAGELERMIDWSPDLAPVFAGGRANHGRYYTECQALTPPVPPTREEQLRFPVPASDGDAALAPSPSRGKTVGTVPARRGHVPKARSRKRRAAPDATPDLQPASGTGLRKRVRIAEVAGLIRSTGRGQRLLPLCAVSVPEVCRRQLVIGFPTPVQFIPALEQDQQGSMGCHSTGGTYG